MSEDTLEPTRLHELFTYDEGTGFLFWKKRPLEDFPDERAAKMWNTKFAGKRAGSSSINDDRRRVRIQIDGFSSNYLAYRIIWAMHHGKWPDNTIDHINGDQTDDRIANLRDVKFQENAKNLAVPAACKTGVPGVNWDPVKGKWQARINDNGREVWLGYFDQFEHAVIARKAAERALGFHRNHGRPARIRQVAA